MSDRTPATWLRSGDAFARELDALDAALAGLPADALPHAELEAMQVEFVRLRVRARALTETLAAKRGA